MLLLFPVAVLPLGDRKPEVAFRDNGRVALAFVLLLVPLSWREALWLRLMAPSRCFPVDPAVAVRL